MKRFILIVALLILPATLLADNSRFSGRGNDRSIPPRGNDNRLAPRGNDATLPPRGNDSRLAPRGNDVTLPPRGNDPTLAPRGNDPTLPPRGNESTPDEPEKSSADNASPSENNTEGGSPGTQQEYPSKPFSPMNY